MQAARTGAAAAAAPAATEGPAAVSRHGVTGADVATLAGRVTLSAAEAAAVLGGLPH